MAVTYGATGTLLLVSSATTTFNVAYPSGITAGDLLVLHLVTNGGAPSSTPPSGWTEVFREASAVSNPRGGVYIKIASGSESGTLAVTVTSTTGVAQISRYSGVDATTPQDVTRSIVEVSTTGDTTISLPSITTVTDGAMLLAFGAANSTSKQYAAVSGMTERVDFTQSLGTSKSGCMFEEARPTAGATGTRDLLPTSPGVQHWGVLMALRPDQGGPPALLSTLVQRVAGISATPTTAVRVAVKTTACSSARLKLGTDSGLTTGVVFGSAGTPDADGYVTLTATGLTANTRYYYRVEMTDSNSTVGLDTMSTVGRIKTAPSGQANFAFDFGSCANSTDPIVFPLITARADDMFFHLGDMFYNDGSGTTLSNIRSKLEGKIQATNHAALYAQINMAHTPGDHDVAQNDSNNGSDATAWANYRTASAQLFPDVDLYYTWVWGRVRFIKLDLMNFATTPTATDNSSKSLLGTTQKQWFKDTIDAATEPAIVIVQSDPFVGSAIANDSGWFGFTTERTELVNYMVASTKNFIIIGGDMHAVAADDGTNSPGGFTVFQAAPFGQTASQKGGPWSVGPVPSSGTAFVTHYGRVVVTDTGSSIAFAFNGYDSTDTSIASLTKTFDLSQDFDASANFSGSGTLTASATPAFSVTSNLSGSGTLTSTRTMAVSRSAALSGSGTLSQSVTVAFSRSAGLSGSGTLVGANVAPAITVTPGLSGSGTLEGVANGLTSAVSVNLSGTGTLSRAVVVNFTASMTQTSTGTLGVTVGTVSMQASVFLSSTGTLAGSGFVPAITKSVALSGSGTLSSTVIPAFSIDAGLSGDGILSASSSNSFTRTANLSGSGTLSANVTNVTLSASAALFGSGTLLGGTVNNKSIGANLSGSGALSSNLTSVGFTQSTGSFGSGTLTGSSVKNFTANAQLSGAGALSVTVVVHKTANLPRDGFGDLDANAVGMSAAVSANLVGVGALSGSVGEAMNHTFTATLGEPRWDGALEPNRWDGSLP